MRRECGGGRAAAAPDATDGRMASVRAAADSVPRGSSDRQKETGRRRERELRRSSRDPPAAIFSQVNLRVGYFQAQLIPQTLRGRGKKGAAVDDGPSGRKWVSELWFRLCTDATAAAAAALPLSASLPMTEFAV